MATDFIDWKNIRTKADLNKVNQDLLYDESQIRDPIDMRHLNPNLTEEEANDAMYFKRYVNGIMLITGDPGGGKGVFLHLLSKKLKYYFQKMPVLDTRPRRCYGEYIPFSKEFLAEQIYRMAVMESGNGEMSNDGKWYARMKDEENEHHTYLAEILLRNTTMGLDEYANKYMPRTQPNLAISIDLLKLYDFRRHLQCLTLGVGVDSNDFNRKALKKTSWEAHCRYIGDAKELEDDPTALIFGVTIYNVIFDEYKDKLMRDSVIDKLRINAKTPQHMLNGYAWKDIFNTQNAQGFDSAVARQLNKRSQ